jgi:hypothetical protein
MSKEQSPAGNFSAIQMHEAPGMKENTLLPSTVV